MTAYGKMKESEAFRNYCRALNLDISKFNVVGKDLDSYRNDSYWGKIIKESEMFVGVIDSVSPHPCATLLLNEPLSKKLGVIKVGDVFVTLIDSYNSDKYKYLKNDYLTVTVWDIISKVYDEIGMPIDDVRQLLNKVESDDKVWDLYKNGLVSTLNQAGTASGKPQIMQYKPKNIRELSGWVSAIRPSFSSMKHYFLNRKDFSYGIDELDTLLKSSDNFILYQENIMNVLQFAGFPEDETYGLLKAIAKKKEGIIEPIQERFMTGFMAKTDSEENALKVWKIIEDAVGYGFNSSHAYAVALDSVYGAYLKANFPLEYYSTILNIYEGNTSKQGEIFEELAKFGITVKPIEFGKSSGKYIKDASDNSIYKGIGSIKFLNSSVADELYNLANSKDFSSVDAVDLFKEIIDNTSANTRQMNILIRLGYFKQFGDWIELAEIFQCMTDSKKPDTDKYPEFKDKEVIIEKKNKKGEIRNELKIIKKPLKYSSTLKEETKLQRLQNIREYAEAVKLNPPTKPSVYNQIMFEKDNLGYSTTTYPNLPDNMVIVMDINTKYTPVVTFMKLNSGETLTAKVKKGKMYDEFGMPFMDLGYILKITDTHIEEGWKKVDDKWERDSTKNVLFVDKVKVIRREETTNDTSR